jgi:predicted dehydrogenase
VRSVALPSSSAPCEPSKAAVSFIGAGNYAGRVLIAEFRAAEACLKTIVTSLGVSAVHYGEKFGFRMASTDSEAALSDPETNIIVIATRHDSHARLTMAAIEAGKNVFVEKPLCLTERELDEICLAHQRRVALGGRLQVMVGFNRRFSPLIVKARALLSTVEAPKSLMMTVNAGAIPSDHWTQDPQIGGGRLVGEGCHFVDLMRHLVGARIVDFDVTTLGEDGGPPRSDNAAITLRFADGSFGVIHYLANGHRSLSKERLEVFCAGRVLQLDNFMSMRGYGWPGFSRMKLWRQDKGQAACVVAFLDSVRKGTEAPIPFEQIVEVSAVSIALAERGRTRRVRSGLHK